MAQRRRDRRRAAALFTLAAVLGFGALLDQRNGHPGDRSSARPGTSPAAAPVAASPHDAEVRRRFDQAVVMLHARQYEHAAVALHRVLRLAPTLAEAHVNMGYALLGLKRAREARDFFEGALALAPAQANAYFGLALAWEASGDVAMATGAMRSYLHLASNERPEHLRRARAALWEWESARAGTPAPR
jgi:Flp pilus assembly protein TadD